MPVSGTIEESPYLTFQHVEDDFVLSVGELSRLIYKNATAKGFYDRPVNAGEKIALMHSELSEALEAIRQGDPMSEKIPDFTCVEEEMADAVIRIFDFAEHAGLRLSKAIIAKHNYNTTRPKMHGGKAF